MSLLTDTSLHSSGLRDPSSLSQGLQLGGAPSVERPLGMAVRGVLYTALYMASTRTQIYLTDEQRRRLDVRGRRTGAPMARMIREAVDAYLADDRPDTDAALDETFGTLPDLEPPSRDEWDRDADPRR